MNLGEIDRKVSCLIGDSTRLMPLLRTVLWGCRRTERTNPHNQMLQEYETWLIRDSVMARMIKEHNAERSD